MGDPRYPAAGSAVHCVFWAAEAGDCAGSFFVGGDRFFDQRGAYCAETIRAALEPVPVGQLEAGYCVGMSYLQTVCRIILPQAMRTAFPPLSNSLIAMVKDTSLAANITVTEMFMATQRIVARTYEPLALYIEVGLIYLMFSTVLTRLQRIGEKKLNAAYGKQGG